MPYSAGRQCRYKACNNITTSAHGYCDEHQSIRYQDNRASSRERGYDYEWEIARARKLKHEPRCEDCKLNHGVLRFANMVHHIKAIRDGGTHDESNLRSLCWSCHGKYQDQVHTAHSKRVYKND